MLDQTKVSRYKLSLFILMEVFYMKKMIFGAFLALTITSAFAQDSDLVLNDERWLAEFTTYVCEDGNVEARQVPNELALFNVQFGRLTTDFSLDNVLIKATFTENGQECRYSAMMFADNAAWTIGLVDSKAYSVNGTTDCAEGKNALDSILEFNSYKYLHGRAAIFVNSENAEASCGSDKIGIHFQARGRIN